MCGTGMSKCRGMRTNELQLPTCAKDALSTQEHVDGCGAPKKTWNQPSLNINWAILPFNDFAHISRCTHEPNDSSQRPGTQIFQHYMEASSPGSLRWDG